jgi:hypothetical protein
MRKQKKDINFILTESNIKQETLIGGGYSSNEKVIGLKEKDLL